MRKEIEDMLTWIKEHKDEVPYECGIFSTPNVVGDPIDVIYDKDSIEIDACYAWSYIEIFGLTDEEFEEVAERIINI